MCRLLNSTSVYKVGLSFSSFFLSPSFSLSFYSPLFFLPCLLIVIYFCFPRDVLSQSSQPLLDRHRGISLSVEQLSHLSWSHGSPSQTVAYLSCTLQTKCGPAVHVFWPSPMLRKPWCAPTSSSVQSLPYIKIDTLGTWLSYSLAATYVL